MGCRGSQFVRIYTPEEVASLFASQASDKASFINGQYFVVDDGETAEGLASQPLFNSLPRAPLSQVIHAFSGLTLVEEPDGERSKVRCFHWASISNVTCT
jgi:hypothetical protein